MDDRQIRQLREKYSRMTDEEIKELLAAGRDEFEPEAFNLLAAEADRRRIELEEEIAAAGRGDEPAEIVEKVVEAEYAELAVVNDPSDKEAIGKILDSKGLTFYFNPASFTGQPFPVMLAVEMSRAQEAFEALKDFRSPNTILFK